MDRFLEAAPVIEGRPEALVHSELQLTSEGELLPAEASGEIAQAEEPAGAPSLGNPEPAGSEVPVSEADETAAAAAEEAARLSRQAARKLVRQAKKAAKAAKPKWAATAAQMSASPASGADQADEPEVAEGQTVGAPSAEAAAVEEASASEAEPEGPYALVPEPLRPALQARGFTQLTTVQSAVLQEAVEGRDLQISSQTGSGKTVALGFVLARTLMQAPATPAAGPRCLIIVPTRELANQVAEELAWLLAALPKRRVAAVTGGTPLFRDRQILGQRPEVLVGTPGRLLDHLRSGQLDGSAVLELVLDEADQMLDMGFREDLEAILDTLPPTRRTHLVSATFPDGILRLAERYQKDPVAIEGTRLGDANQDIEHVAYAVDRTLRYGVLVNLLLLGGNERTLVFVERRADAVEVAERLEADGFAALPLSGELAQTQRERTMAAFRSGKINVLVATDVAARGLDVPDVATVIHTAPPIDASIYTHRSGRTGRAGKRGKSVLFAPHYRRRFVERMVWDAGIELKWLPIPNTNQVRKQVAEKARAALEAELVAALEAGPAPKQLEHAQALLEGRDPAALVAVLLARLQPASQGPGSASSAASPSAAGDSGGLGAGSGNESRPERRPAGRPLGRPVADAGDGDSGEYPPRPVGDFAPRSGGDFAGRPGAERYGAPARFERSPRRGAGGDAVRFFMNWGINQGATPGRLLAAVCRRGQVQGSDIGSIAIHPNASTFSVRAEVAEQFEDLAGRRDQRDPQIVIRRDRALH